MWLWSLNGSVLDCVIRIVLLFVFCMWRTVPATRAKGDKHRMLGRV